MITRWEVFEHLPKSYLIKSITKAKTCSKRPTSVRTLVKSSMKNPLVERRPSVGVMEAFGVIAA